jgi:fumarate hydratase class II
MGQSNNDVIPSAIHISLAEELKNRLIPALEKLHGALEAKAKVFKIANDIRWLRSDPRCGIDEIHFPRRNLAAPITPGKVNPVMCESVTMV